MLLKCSYGAMPRWEPLPQWQATHGAGRRVLHAWPQLERLRSHLPVTLTRGQSLYRQQPGVRQRPPSGALARPGARAHRSAKAHALALAAGRTCRAVADVKAGADQKEPAALLNYEQVRNLQRCFSCCDGCNRRRCCHRQSRRCGETDSIGRAMFTSPDRGHPCFGRGCLR